MERIIFDRMAALDQTHWWYVARRQILSDLIAREVRPPAAARILEIGCGTGHNFPVFTPFGTLDAMEIDEAARAIATQRLGRPVGAAPLPELPGIADASYDLIALLDVLEHIEGDLAALASIRSKLRPGGKILLTVPANAWMWSAHDTVHHHFRRYNQKTLSALIAQAGLRIDMISHFNSLLFPLAATVRLVGKMSGREEADDAQPAAPVNALLTKLFACERHLVGRLPLPFGVSLVAILSDGSNQGTQRA